MTDENVERSEATAHPWSQSSREPFATGDPSSRGAARLESHADVSGENLAPEDWVDAYGDYLFRYAYSRLRDSNAAEEVVQETLMAGIRYLEQFRGQGSQRGWLLGILRRKIVDHVRQRARYDRASSFDDGNDPSAQLFDEGGNWRQAVMAAELAPDRNIESKELWEVVRGCLSSLPAGQADVFTLAVMEEMESDEICRELDITPSNYWVRLHRARLGLARCVGAKWFHDQEMTQRVK